MGRPLTFLNVSGVPASMLVVILINDFFKNLGISSLDIYFDPDFKLVKIFKMRGLPTSILINKDGKEFGRVVGEVNFNSEEFIKLLKKYI